MDPDHQGKELRLICFTDPLCCTCWAWSPWIRKLEVEYGHSIEIEYKMGGLLDSWETFVDPSGTVTRPQDLQKIWNSTGKDSGMSIDGDIWAETPMNSSRPPSLAYYAVKKVAPEKSERYLRLIRELLFLKKEDITSTEVLTQAAESIGLSGKAFEKEMNSVESLSSFNADLDEKQKYHVKSLPSYILINRAGKTVRIHFSETYESFERAIRILSKGEIVKKVCRLSVLEVIRKYGYLSTVEISALVNTDLDTLEKELTALSEQNLAEGVQHKFSIFWKSKITRQAEKKAIEDTSRIAILGAGVAGLSAAIFLKKTGKKIHVFERALNNSRQGLGFLILPNGLRILNQTGLEPEFLEKGNLIHKVRLMMPDGKLITEKEISGSFAISRRNCVEILKGKLDNSEISYGKEVKTFHRDSNNTITHLEFNDGWIEKPSFTIASDGAHSKCRTMLFPDHESRVTEEKEIVCITSMPELAARLGNTFIKLVCPEKGYSMGVIPAGNGDLIWFIQLNERMHKIPMNNSCSLESFSKAISKSFPDEFQSVIEKSDFSNAFLWEINDMDLLPSFHKNGILLIGDSAHPLLSFSSQGASSALEDSYYIAQLLKEKGNTYCPEDIFAEFYANRKETIQNFIDGGRFLLNQFLSAQKQKYPNIPLVNYGAK
ncbi:MAG: DsbA family protein [Bacteroidia bacterium]